MPTTGIDNELRRLQAGLRALGERLEQEREAGLMSDTELTRLAKVVDAMAFQVEAMNKEKLPAIQASLDKINGRTSRVEDSCHDYDKRIGLVEQFNRAQVEPALKQVQDNKLEIAKRTAAYGMIAIITSAAISGAVQLLIHALS